MSPVANLEVGLKASGQGRPGRPLLHSGESVGDGGVALARARSARPDGPPAAVRRAAPSGLAS